MSNLTNYNFNVALPHAARERLKPATQPPNYYTRQDLTGPIYEDTRFYNKYYVNKIGLLTDVMPEPQYDRFGREISVKIVREFTVDPFLAYQFSPFKLSQLKKGSSHHVIRHKSVELGYKFFSKNTKGFVCWTASVVKNVATWTLSLVDSLVEIDYESEPISFFTSLKKAVSHTWSKAKSYCNQVKKITIGIIKKCWKHRFRSELIDRWDPILVKIVRLLPCYFQKIDCLSYLASSRDSAFLKFKSILKLP